MLPKRTLSRLRSRHIRTKALKSPLGLAWEAKGERELAVVRSFFRLGEVPPLDFIVGKVGNSGTIDSVEVPEFEQDIMVAICGW